MTQSPPPRVTTAEIAAILRAAPAGSGVVWALTRSEQVNVNLVRLEPDEEIPSHPEPDLDVVMVIISGEGSLEADGEVHHLEPLLLVHLSRGTDRTIRAGRDGLAYLSVHGRRHAPGIADPSLLNAN